MVILNAYIDDSLAQSNVCEFCLAGYMATAGEWMKFSDAWDDAMREDPKIEAFKASDAESLKGEFLGWQPEARDKKVYRLAQVIDSHSLASFDCRLSKRDFEEILLPVCPYDLRSPYFSLFFGVMINAARQLDHFKIDVPIDFIFDEQGRVGAEAALWYGPSRALQPPHLRKLLGNRPTFRTDDKMLPLQAADCLVWHLRRSREEQFKGENRPALALLRKDCHTEMEISEQTLRYWAAGFKKIVPKGDRLRRGASVVQQMKKFEAYVMKRPKDNQDSEYEVFNETMDAILKADAVKVKTPMGAEKKDREAKRLLKES